MVGEQITVGKLIEKCMVMRIFMEMIIYIGIMSETSRLILLASTTITPPIDRYPACIYDIKFIKTESRLKQDDMDVNKANSINMNKPHRFILNGNNTNTCLDPFLSLDTEHRKI